ncbi:MAG: Gfo/Idh/MocA family oxidoreductase [Armatimonadetes bacterium]|nr:Gfo/Idh/MocA family oxidoreductase [Armatimonadota bacterium]
MRVALVGASGFGRYHLQVWRKHHGAANVTVVGRDPERLAAIAAELAVTTTTDLDAAFDQAELVDVCVPTDRHAEIARRALARGLPAIVEKPPCRTSAEAEQLAREARGTPLSCVMNQRFSPVWCRVRELVAEGAVGRPMLSLWPVLTDQRKLLAGGDFRSDASRGGGALLDGAFHLAYLIPWVLGREVTAVSAWAGQLAARPPAGEDTGLLALELGECVAQVTYSWAVPNPPRTPAATVLGDEATLVVPRSAKQPIELIRDRETVELDLGAWRTAPRNDLESCLLHHAEGAASGAADGSWADAVQAQRVVEAAERAAAAGRREELG